MAGQHAEAGPTSRHWVRPAPTADQRRNDVLIAVGLFCLSILSLALFRAIGLFEDPAGPVVSVAALALLTFPLAVRRSRPVVAVLGAATGLVIMTELEVPEGLVREIALFLALYTLGAWGQNRRRVQWVQIGVIAVMALWLLVAFFRASLEPGDDEPVVGAMTPVLAMMLYQLLVNVLYFGGALWFGQHAWNSARNEARLQEQAEQLRAERETVAAQAVSLERMRIARELHDSVAHHVSLMGVQAGAARTLLRHDPTQAEQFIRHIEEAARQSVDEMHTLIGVLRGNERPDDDDSASSLGVEQIPDLVEQTEAAGLEVSYTVLGDPVPLRPLVSLCLYRIVQESLTNARKHAGPGARVDLRLRYRDSTVEIECTDDGARRRTSPTQEPSSGHGLVGMAERTAALGGTLETGPRTPSGFRIRAELPLQPAASAQARTESASPQPAGSERSHL